jgi:hypothetical protein
MIVHQEPMSSHAAEKVSVTSVTPANTWNEDEATTTLNV